MKIKLRDYVDKNGLKASATVLGLAPPSLAQAVKDLRDIRVVVTEHLITAYEIRAFPSPGGKKRASIK